jgi:hypothetical protein
LFSVRGLRRPVCSDSELLSNDLSRYLVGQRSAYRNVSTYAEHTFMSRAEIGPPIPVFKRSNNIHNLDGGATVIGVTLITKQNIPSDRTCRAHGGKCYEYKICTDTIGTDHLGDQGVGRGIYMDLAEICNNYVHGIEFVQHGVQRRTVMTVTNLWIEFQYETS